MSRRWFRYASALEGSDPDIVVPAIRAVAWRGDTQSSAALERLLTARDPSVRLAAAEALARVGSPSVMATLWQRTRCGPRSISGTCPHSRRTPACGCSRIAASVRASQSHSAEGGAAPAGSAATAAKCARPCRQSLTGFVHKNPELRQVARQVLERHPEWAGHAVGLPPRFAGEARAIVEKTKLPWPNWCSPSWRTTKSKSWLRRRSETMAASFLLTGACRCWS